GHSSTTRKSGRAQLAAPDFTGLPGGSARTMPAESMDKTAASETAMDSPDSGLFYPRGITAGCLSL
ncbi:MAG: hypothetical protein WAN64_13400, partial [Pseudolabrys sp.]